MLGSGEVTEWSIVLVSKTSRDASPSGVRIPPSPLSVFEVLLDELRERLADESQGSLVEIVGDGEGVTLPGDRRGNRVLPFLEGFNRQFTQLQVALPLGGVGHLRSVL